MKYFTVLMVMAMMVLGGTSWAHDSIEPTVGYHAYEKVPHNTRHHFFYNDGRPKEYNRFLWHKARVIDTRLDMNEALHKDIYIATCSSPGRNVAACTRMAANIKAITDYEDAHYEAFCVSDLTRSLEKIGHDRNLFITGNYYMGNGAYKVCIGSHKKGRNKAFFTQLRDDYESYLNSERIIEHLTAAVYLRSSHFDDFLSWRAEFRQPE